jgi:hypothetical protein
VTLGLGDKVVSDKFEVKRHSKHVKIYSITGNTYYSIYLTQLRHHQEKYRLIYPLLFIQVCISPDYALIARNIWS